jgi:hypothetical protein
MSIMLGMSLRPKLILTSSGASYFFSILGKISTGFAAILVFFLVCRLFPGFPSGIALDNSWIVGLQEGIAKGLVFGQDIIFTFGPYAGVYTQEFNPGSDAITLYGSIFLGFAYAALFLRWAQGYKRSLFPVIFALLLAGILHQRDALFMFYPALLTFWSVREYGVVGNGQFRLNFPKVDFILLAFQFSALGFLPLIKGSLIAPVIVTIVLLAWLMIRVDKPRHAVLGLGMPVFACIMAWLMAGQPFLGIFSYFGTMLSIVAGYTNAMSSPGSGAELVL